MNGLVGRLDDFHPDVYLSTFSALDAYFGVSSGNRLMVSTAGTLIDLAKAFPEIEYPGIEGMDARVPTAEGEIYFSCHDDVTRPPKHPFTALNLLYDFRNRKFVDPYEGYWDVRARALRPGVAPQNEPSWQIIADAAVALSRYSFRLEPEIELVPPPSGVTMEPASQKLLLELLLTGRNPKPGFELLRSTGFISRHWPELERMDGINHSKAHHPEGNVWEHTLETFGYRKTPDLALSLGLLFHDSGKPFAVRNEGRMFDGHAEIGAQIVVAFLNRLGFPREIVDDVRFLVRQHMLPPFIAKLATYRTEHILASPLFPLLLELYRCDISATYRGPDGYYEACKVYRRFLRNARNPFRSADGKKLLRLYVEP